MERDQRRRIYRIRRGDQVGVERSNDQTSLRLNLNSECEKESSSIRG